MNISKSKGGMEKEHLSAEQISNGIDALMKSSTAADDLHKLIRHLVPNVTIHDVQKNVVNQFKSSPDYREHMISAALRGAGCQ
jgi:hypothetical protein